ncbi:hypothetical protein C8J55DRAFT_324971 [Lentinula edodes]|uniref:Secreted protein n=1 Tax=Lentinula lateritia TaxID=40482 RepID=A0A9W9DUP0_9AGAR|nr:hypothetical protein C8J55DRAFT_324971 [Lentinula edodes]
MKFFVTLGFLLIAMNAVLSVNALFSSAAVEACGHVGKHHKKQPCSYDVKTKKGRRTVTGTCEERSDLHFLRHYVCVPAGATPASSTAAASSASATAAANMDSSSGTTGAGAGAAGAGAAPGAGTSPDGTSAGDGSMRRRKRHWSSREPREQEDMVAN